MPDSRSLSALPIAASFGRPYNGGKGEWAVPVIA